MSDWKIGIMHASKDFIMANYGFPKVEGKKQKEKLHEQLVLGNTGLPSVMSKSSLDNCSSLILSGGIGDQLHTFLTLQFNSFRLSKSKMSLMGYAKKISEGDVPPSTIDFLEETPEIKEEQKLKLVRRPDNH